MITELHPYSRFWKKNDALLRRKVLRMLCSFAKLSAVGREFDGKKIWREAGREYHSAVLME